MEMLYGFFTCGPCKWHVNFAQGDLTKNLELKFHTWAFFILLRGAQFLTFLDIYILNFATFFS